MQEIFLSDLSLLSQRVWLIAEHKLTSFMFKTAVVIFSNFCQVILRGFFSHFCYAEVSLASWMHNLLHTWRRQTKLEYFSDAASIPWKCYECFEYYIFVTLAAENLFDGFNKDKFSNFHLTKKLVRIIADTYYENYLGRGGATTVKPI